MNDKMDNYLAKLLVGFGVAWFLVLVFGMKSDAHPEYAGKHKAHDDVPSYAGSHKKDHDKRDYVIKNDRGRELGTLRSTNRENVKVWKPRWKRDN